MQNSFIPTISIPIPGGGTYDRIADKTSGEINQINSKLITIFKFIDKGNRVSHAKIAHRSLFKCISIFGINAHLKHFHFKVH